MAVKLSVIIPVFNIKKEYLEKCIESVINQDMQEMEIILVNDGSSLMSCNDVCSHAAKKDARVIYINKKNEGVSVARNMGIEKASGEYLMFVDADDWLEDEICGRAYEYAREKDVDLLFFGYCTSYTNREVTRILDYEARQQLDSSQLELGVLQRIDIFGAVDLGTPWGKLIRRNVIQENNVRYIRGLTKGQDTVFSLYLFEACRKIAYLDIVGYHYRVSESSISKKYNPDIVLMMEKTLKEYDRFVKEHKKEACFQQAVKNKYAAVVLGEYLPLYYFHKKNKNSFWKVRREIVKLLLREPYHTYIKDAELRGIIGRLKIFLLKRKDVFLLSIMIKTEQKLRNIVIHKYE